MTNTEMKGKVAAVDIQSGAIIFHEITNGITKDVQMILTSPLGGTMRVILNYDELERIRVAVNHILGKEKDSWAKTESKTEYQSADQIYNEDKQ